MVFEKDILEYNIYILLLSYYYITLYYINAVCSIYNYTISMQTVVYNSPLYCLLLFFRCILNVYYYQIIIVLLLFYYYFLPARAKGST